MRHSSEAENPENSRNRDDTNLIQRSHVKTHKVRAPLNVNSVDTRGTF